MRETIITALGDKGSENLTTTTDLFAFGVDSLQAARFRNVISKSLDLGGRPLRSNIVFENPSISQLADYLLTLNHGGSGEKTDEQQHQLMLDLVDKYTAQLYKAGPGISSSVTQSDNHVVVRCLRLCFRSNSIRSLPAPLDRSVRISFNSSCPLTRCPESSACHALLLTQTLSSGFKNLLRRASSSLSRLKRPKSLRSRPM